MSNDLVVKDEFDRLLGVFGKEEALLKEAELEKEYMYCIQELDKDVVVTDLGKKEARSIGLQINNWIKSLDVGEKDVTLTLQGSSNSYSEFKKYMLGKYSGKKNRDWEEKLSNPDFEKDAIRLMRSRIYEHKANRTRSGVQMFVSPDAHFHYQGVELIKKLRSSQFETYNRGLKIYWDEDGEEGFRYKELAKNEDLLINAMTIANEKSIKSLIPKLLPQRDSKVDVYLEEKYK